MKTASISGRYFGKLALTEAEADVRLKGKVAPNFTFIFALSVQNVVLKYGKGWKNILYLLCPSGHHRGQKGQDAKLKGG